VPTLRKRDFTVDVVPTGNAALERAREFNPDLVVINAASLRTNGKRICRAIREQMSKLPILMITNLEQLTGKEENCANIVLTLPFTTRKLINRIAPFIPVLSQHQLQAGQIKLDLERRQVRCMEKEARLTPRLVRILEILLEHPGEVVERENLFRRAWKTDYTGDTRTLDVHISWLRQALEEDPHHPRFLKTIRQVGYRLDV